MYEGEPVLVFVEHRVYVWQRCSAPKVHLFDMLDFNCTTILQDRASPLASSSVAVAIGYCQPTGEVCCSCDARPACRPSREAECRKLG